MFGQEPLPLGASSGKSKGVLPQATKEKYKVAVKPKTQRSMAKSDGKEHTPSSPLPPICETCKSTRRFFIGKMIPNVMEVQIDGKNHIYHRDATRLWKDHLGKGVHPFQTPVCGCCISFCVACCVGGLGRRHAPERCARQVHDPVCLCLYDLAPEKMYVAHHHFCPVRVWEAWRDGRRQDATCALGEAELFEDDVFLNVRRGAFAPL